MAYRISTLLRHRRSPGALVRCRRFSSEASGEMQPDEVTGELLRDPVEVASVFTFDTSNLWPIFRGPAHAISSCLDTIHDATGAPWWVVLVGSTFAMRTALLPITLLQLQKTNKFAQVAGKLPPPVPVPGTKLTYSQQFKLYSERRKELGAPSPAWFFASFAVQVPIFISWIVTIRQMAITKYPGFDSGGTLWFTDLTQRIDDSLGVLFPSAVALLYVCNIEVSFKGLQAKPGLAGRLLMIYSWWLRLCSIPVYISGFFLPQGVFMYWLPNSAFSLAQTIVLRNPGVRKALDLPVIPAPAKAVADGADAAADVSSDELFKLAAEHVSRNNRDAAVECLRNIVAKDPENATAYYALGKLHAEANQWDDGAALLAIAASKAKQDKLQISAYLSLGIALQKQGKLDDGITALKPVAGMDVPEDPQCRRTYYMALVTLGSLLVQNGQKEAALEYLERAATYDPKVNDLYVKKIKEELEGERQEKSDASPL